MFVEHFGVKILQSYICDLNFKIFLLQESTSKFKVMNTEERRAKDEKIVKQMFMISERLRE